jgi:hypothetical protein
MIVDLSETVWSQGREGKGAEGRAEGRGAVSANCKLYATHSENIHKMLVRI